MIRKGSVLVVGPGIRGRGGIAAVIQMHRQSSLREHWNLRMLSTYDDRTSFHKICEALKAYLLAPWLLLSVDIVHIHLSAQVSLARKLPIVFLARLLRRPMIVHLHAATEDSLFVHTPQYMARYVFHAANYVIALSHSWAALIRQHLPKANVKVIFNPILLHDANQLTGQDRPTILLVGKLDARKGYRDLLAAALIVLQQIPSAQFWLAGHGEVAEARLLSQELGIHRNVRLLGWVDRTELEAIYRQTDILALPSYGEGVPMSVLEAMSYGIPVVCTPVGGVPEWIEHEHNGLLVAPGDISALARQILRLLQDSQYAATIGAAGRRTVQQRCTLEMISKQIDELYTSMMSGVGKRWERDA